MKRFLPLLVWAYLMPASALSAVTKKICKMCGKSHVPLVSLVLLSGLAMAQEWWETKPYLEWSADQVEKVLDDSPWVATSPARSRLVKTDDWVGPGRVPGIPGAEPIPDLLPGGQVLARAQYRLRLLTAKPVRQALLRQLALRGLVQVTVDSEDYDEKEPLELYIASRPDDLRVKGDEQHIVVGITLRTAGFDFFDRPIWIEDPFVEELSKIDSSALMEVTTLSTNTRKAALIRFDPPGSDMLGGKFYFPRVLSDGMPLISGGDKRLRFQTRIGEASVKVDFNLRKMSYKGKLES